MVQVRSSITPGSLRNVYRLVPQLGLSSSLLAYLGCTIMASHRCSQRTGSIIPGSAPFCGEREARGLDEAYRYIVISKSLTSDSPVQQAAEEPEPRKPREAQEAQSPAKDARNPPAGAQCHSLHVTMSLCHRSLFSAFTPPRVDPSPNAPPSPFAPTSDSPPTSPSKSPLGYHMASVMGGRYESSMGFGRTKQARENFALFYHLPSRLVSRLA